MFRKGDFWGDVAVDFNEMQARVVTERNELANLRLEVAKLKDRLAHSQSIDYLETAIVRDTGCNP